jgi:hypothetical protein
MDNYITPILSNYSSLDELLQEKNYDGNFSLLDVKHQFKQINFFNNGSFFVLGEPGVGKSTLLEQVRNDAHSNGLTALFLKLDKLPNKTVEESIKGLLPDQKTLVILDSLDEVDSNNFDVVLNEILSFHQENPDVSLIISCRTHYLSKSKDLASSFQKFNFIRINLFNNDQVFNYLEKNLPDNPDLIDNILKNTNTNTGNYVLNTPRYLNVLVELLKNKKTRDKLKDFSKVNFFEEFIYHKLDEAKVDKNEAVLIKRVLEKLALIMEIYQVNKITKDELITFLDEIDSNIGLIFLNTVHINKFIERVLKATDDILEFDNSEFQEYLAAKELLRLGDKSQVLYDLIIEPNFKNINANWFDVLKYVLEIDSRQLLNLIDYLSNNIDRHLSDDLITLIINVNPEAFTSKEKSKIFDTIFNYHKKNKIYLGRRVINSIILFYTSENEHLLSKINLLDKDKFHLSNQLFTVAHLIRIGKYGKKDKLIKLLNRNTIKIADENILHLILSVYEYNNSLSDLKNVEFLKKLNYELYKAFVNTSISINPNHEYTLDQIILAVKDNKERVISWINDIEDIDSILSFIKKINTSKTLLKNLVTQENSFFPREYGNIFSKIRLNWNITWFKLLKKQVAFYLKEFDLYELNNDYYFNELIKVLRDFDNSFLSYFLVKETFQYYSYNIFIAQSINSGNLIYLQKRFHSEKDVVFLHSIFLWIKLNDKNNYVKIKKNIKKLFPSIFALVENYKPENIEEFEKSKILNEFNKLIEPSVGKYNTSVFKFFIKNHSIILTYGNSNKIKKLQTIIINIFKYTDKFKFNIKIERLSPTSSRIHTNNTHLLHYSTYLKTGILLGMEDILKDYRNQFIKLLPIIIQDEYKEDVLNFIGDIDDKDKNTLIEFCTNREDDFLKYSVMGLINIVEKYKLNQLMPLIKGFVADPNIEMYNKIPALKCITNVEYDATYLNKLFASSKSDPSLQELTDITNECLVVKYQMPEAILWRISEIKKRIMPFNRSEDDDGFYSRKFEEVDSFSFSNCIINLRDIKYASNVNELLDLSFSISNEITYLTYSTYLQKIVQGYYKELKYMKSITPLNFLRQHYSISSSSEKWRFGKYFKDLEIEYSQILFKPNNIVDCVKRYNEIKSKSYLKIYNDLELLSTIKTTINEGIHSFIQNEGFFKSYQKDGILKANEDFIQKSIKIQLENLLLKKGLRFHEVIREPQSFSDLRPDFIISYGFIGPIVLEIKFNNNPQIQNKAKRKSYANKLENDYRKGFNAKYGIYLILEKDNCNNATIRHTLSEEYSSLKNWEVIFLNCLN